MFLVGELGDVIQNPGSGSYYLRIKPVEGDGKKVCSGQSSLQGAYRSLFPAIFRADVMELWNIRSAAGISTFRAVLLLAIIGLLPVSGWLQRLDWLIYDEIISRQSFQPDSEIVIVAIDEESQQIIGKWPWSRELYAELIGRLSRIGSNVVALDLLLSEPDLDHPGADNRLKSAISAHGNVVLPVTPAKKVSPHSTTGVVSVWCYAWPCGC